MMNNEVYNERLRLLGEIRDMISERGLTVQAVADAAGLHRSNVSRILNGRYSPELDSLLKIAAALELRLELISQ